MVYLSAIRDGIIPSLSLCRVPLLADDAEQNV